MCFGEKVFKGERLKVVRRRKGRRAKEDVGKVGIDGILGIVGKAPRLKLILENVTTIRNKAVIKDFPEAMLNCKS
ncbi:hypothetical protein VNO78_11564 [Psophocarpus tetragonolobus]|uniref:Uncharacterized protein n=1 Tax=Psophocarpus tetragonolobus TaxID=3891 RepID=A0AAN9XNA7_PSOTE